MTDQKKYVVLQCYVLCSCKRDFECMCTSLFIYRSRSWKTLRESCRIPTRHPSTSRQPSPSLPPPTSSSRPIATTKPTTNTNQSTMAIPSRRYQLLSSERKSCHDDNWVNCFKGSLCACAELLSYSCLRMCERNQSKRRLPAFKTFLLMVSCDVLTSFTLRWCHDPCYLLQKLL